MSAGADIQNNAWAHEYWLDTHIAAHFTTIIHAVIFRVISFLYLWSNLVSSLKSQSPVSYLLTTIEMQTNKTIDQRHVGACFDIILHSDNSSVHYNLPLCILKILPFSFLTEPMASSIALSVPQTHMNTHAHFVPLDAATITMTTYRTFVHTH